MIQINKKKIQNDKQNKFMQSIYHKTTDLYIKSFLYINCQEIYALHSTDKVQKQQDKQLQREQGESEHGNSNQTKFKLLDLFSVLVENIYFFSSILLLSFYC